jgi:parallel beta-helix repeat protein
MDDVCRFLKIAVTISLLVVLYTNGAAASTPINSCTTISSPGEYILNQSIINSSFPSCINITSSNVVFDGGGYTIDGILGGYGVYVFESTSILANVTVKNIIVTDWDYGIYFYNITKGWIIDTETKSNERGIYLNSSNNTQLIGNNASSNECHDYQCIDYGIYLSLSSNNALIGNYASNNGRGLQLDSSNNNILSNNNASNNEDGIILFSSSNNKLISNNASNNHCYSLGCVGTLGISISGNNNTLKDNIASNNYDDSSYDPVNLYGISINGNNNTLIDNIASYNYCRQGALGNLCTIFGIGITGYNNTLIGNNASNNYCSYDCPFRNGGIYLSSSNNGILSSNNVLNNSYGIYISYASKSDNNTIIGNNISNNRLYGIYIYKPYPISYNTTIYLNNFINNTKQAYSNSNTNTWDSGYPSSGNYWSEYNGSDFMQGPNQDQSGRDGIGDIPYNIDGGAGAQDRYPFMEMNGWTSSLDTTKTVELKFVWNLISVPLNLTTWKLGDESAVGNPLNVTPENCISSIYRYNTTSFLFEKSDHFDEWGWWPATGSESFTKLEPGRGYWVMAQQDCELTFKGNAPYDLDISLDTGWNLIGWYSMNEAVLGEEAAVVDPLNVTPMNSLTSIYGYNTTSAQFEKSDHFPDWGWWPATGSESFTMMEPGRGYWVMASNKAVWNHKGAK